MGKENFEKIRQWVANLVESFDVGAEKTRVAVVRYSDRPTTEFNLGRYKTLEEVKRAARNIRYLGGNTKTGDAISFTTNNIFTERAGVRPAGKGIQKVAILLTDGRSQDFVLEPSIAAAAAGIRLFAVGIGEALKEELEEIAAEPKTAHVFHVTDFDAIDKIRGRLRRRLCESEYWWVWFCAMYILKKKIKVTKRGFSQQCHWTGVQTCSWRAIDLQSWAPALIEHTWTR